MEFEEKEEQKLDLFVLLDDFLRQAKRLWLLGLVLVLVCGAGLTGLKRMGYTPYYEAYTSFTVRVSNPLYGGIGSYNEKTAQVMAETFPSILTSDLLKTRVAESLGLKNLAGVSITASSQASILTLTVRAQDPQRAYDVLNAVIDCYPEVSEFVVGSTQLLLLDESGVPRNPIAVFNYRNTAVKGAMLGFVLWAGIVVVLILMKNTIHNEEELRRTLNIPCLGQIPAVKVTRRMPVPLIHRHKDLGGFAESMRLLRLRIEKTMEEDEKKVLLVSSAIPGEGKTTVSVNLAASLAQKGKKVLLIDCDLRNPSVVSTLSTKSRPLSSKNSMVDYLRGRATVMELIQPTELENLFIIPGGAGGKNSYAGQLSDERVARLIQAGRNLYDYVILDTPPCALMADASDISAMADCSLLTVRQGFATRQQILEGVQMLSDNGKPLIGCILNMTAPQSGKNYYNSYGYYGYGREKSGRRRKERSNAK